MLMVNHLTGFGVGAGGTDPDWAHVQALVQPTAEAVAANAYPTDETGVAIEYGGGAQLTAAAAVAGGGGIAFDGNGDFAILAGVNLDASTPYVVEAWVTRTSSGAGMVWCKWAGNAGYQFYISSNGRITAYINAAQPFLGSQVIAQNVAVHLAWASDTATLRGYVGGWLDGSAATPSITNTSLVAPRLGLDNQGSVSGALVIHALRVTAGSHRGYTGASIPVPTALWPTA